MFWRPCCCPKQLRLPIRREYMILGLQPALESLEVAVAAVQIYIGTQDVATVQCIIPLIKLDSGRQL